MDSPGQGSFKGESESLETKQEGVACRRGDSEGAARKRNLERVFALGNDIN